MSSKKQKITSASKAVGAAVVALSGFVPMPTMQNIGIPAISHNIRGAAWAKTLAIPLAGSALTGITFGAFNNLRFGTLVATAKTGTFGVKTNGSLTGVAGAKEVANQANADVVYDAAVAAGIDIKVSQIGVITLTGAGAKAGVNDKVALLGINFGSKLGGGALKLTATVAKTTAKATNYAASAKAGATLKIGGTLKWGPGITAPPIGVIPAATAMVITITY